VLRIFCTLVVASAHRSGTTMAHDYELQRAEPWWHRDTKKIHPSAWVALANENG